MMKSVLHICSDYSNQKLYKNLFSLLNDFLLNQFVFVPVRSSRELNLNKCDEYVNIQYRYTHILKLYHRLLFRTKIKLIFNDLKSNVSIEKFDIVHAHYLFSDGAVALKIKQEYNIPYIVAVRNTDINYFIKFRLDLFPLCVEILSEAENIVFLTPSYKDILLKKIPSSRRNYIEKKIVTIPNGLTSAWFSKSDILKNNSESLTKLLYVGNFSKNKNIINFLNAAYLVSLKKNISVTLVGAGGNGEEIVSRMLSLEKFSFVKRIGQIDNENALINVYRNHHIFVMPSFKETFGISYIEALSQGLPIIYSKNQGVDGYFNELNVGESVNPNDENDIALKINLIIDNLSIYKINCIDSIQSFGWSKIAASYALLYNNIK